jgi:hypothetical protein
MLLVQVHVADKQSPASELRQGLDSTLESVLLSALLMHWFAVHVRCLCGDVSATINTEHVHGDASAEHQIRCVQRSF